MGNAIGENKLTTTMKRILWEFSLYWKFMCADKNNDKRKSKLPPLPLFQPSYSFFNCSKTTKPMILKISRLSACFVKKLSIIACLNYFVSQICWRWVEKNISWILIPFITKIEYNISTININATVFL